jgi:transcription initiation factor TFIIIB Brf1 subunit/transcription initiation factor TFIIB
MDQCEHKYPVIDEHEGTTVCCDCGVVLENEFYVSTPCLKDERLIHDAVKDLCKKTDSTDTLEILNRLNLPTDLIYQIPQNEQNVDNLYNIINKNSVITTKEFCAASGIHNKKLVKMNQNKVIDTNISLLLEKYCKMLDLSYRDYTLIKAKLEERPASGHPPLTVVGYYICQYCKTNKIKKSMKQICSVLSISVISIQRYRKYELSCRR